MRAVHSKFGGSYPREFTGKTSAAELCVACTRCPSLAKVHCIPDSAPGEIEEIVGRFTALRVSRSSGLPACSERSMRVPITLVSGSSPICFAHGGNENLRGTLIAEIMLSSQLAAGHWRPPWQCMMGEH
jgi:hypothetical protein